MAPMKQPDFPEVPELPESEKSGTSRTSRSPYREREGFGTGFREWNDHVASGVVGLFTMIDGLFGERLHGTLWR